MQLSASIFKAYDIRGIVPVTIDEAVAEALGRAFGTVARSEGETCIAVGRDGRLSGPALSAALMRGLVAAGVEVGEGFNGHGGTPDRRSPETDFVTRKRNGVAVSCQRGTTPYS